MKITAFAVAALSLAITAQLTVQLTASRAFAHDGMHDETGLGASTSNDAQAPATGVVEFHIAPGTGDQPWNTPNNPVRVKVGQILRLVNDDNVSHYLHTPNAPCPHGKGPFGPGETYDCNISQEATPDRTECYDHRFGPTARFYIEATN